MMVLRREQLEVFQSAAWNQFASDLAGYMRDNHGSRTVLVRSARRKVADLPHELLLTMVKHGIRCAQAEGLTFQSSISSFVVLMFAASPCFFKHPAIEYFLSTGERPLDSHWDGLWQLTTEDDWKEVAESGRNEPWPVQ